MFSGLRVTFPHWSPSSSDEVLSLWCTFSPSHRSLLARFLGGGLRSGDPAALLDARTGALSWMAVSPLEEAQIGHYHQIKRDVRRGVAAVRASRGRRNRTQALDPEPGAEDPRRMARPVVLAPRDRRLPVPLPGEAGPAR